MATSPSRLVIVLAALLSFLFCAQVLAAQEFQDSAEIIHLRQTMRQGDLEQAVTAADAALAARVREQDEALHLKATALFHLGRFADVVAACDELLTTHPRSTWMRKSLFLKAQALTQLRRHEEAERLYEQEAERLLSASRKEEIAAILTRFADDLAIDPDANDPGAPPADRAKSIKLYRRVLGMEIGRGLRDEVLFKLASTQYDASDFGGAVNSLHQYLDEFDPQWAGPVGSVQRARGQKRENPPPAGAHVLEARYVLGKSLLASGANANARQEFEDLLSLARAVEVEKVGDVDSTTFLANVLWQIVRTHDLAQATGDDLERGLKAAREFLAVYPAHPYGVEAAWLIPLALQRHGRLDDACRGYEAFITRTSHRLPDGAAATDVLPRHGKSPAQLQSEWEQQATFLLGEIRLQQRQFEPASQWYQQYVTRFPNGPRWSDAQRRLIDVEYQVALDRIEKRQYAEAEELLGAFLSRHPLDDRAPQAVFIIGQMHATEGDRLHAIDSVGPIGVDAGPDDTTSRAAARAEYQRAIAEWGRLVSKYPEREESGLALYRTGVLLEEKLGDLEGALDAYRRLTWSSWVGEARARIARMTEKQLTLATPRTWRTTEKPMVSLRTRNIEKVTVRQYFLDAEAYFRKTHSTTGVEALDIALIEPDRTWEVAIDGYAKYRPLERLIEVPFDGSRPGVCVINVSEEDFEATTLVIRSDIDFVVRGGRREAIVFAQNMVTGRPVEQARVLLSDGSRVFASGETGADGVWLARHDDLGGVQDLRVFAAREGHIASNALDLRNLRVASGLSPRGFIHTSQPAYRPGQVVQARGVIREVRDGAYHAPHGAEWVVAVMDSAGRLIHEQVVTLSKFGSFSIEAPISPAAPVGEYTITARQKEKGEWTASVAFQVQQFQLPKVLLSAEIDKPVAYRGDMVTATFVARYPWGEPASDRPITIHLPDGRVLADRTNAEGRASVRFDTTGMSGDRALVFQATLDGENVAASGYVMMATYGFRMAVKPRVEESVIGEPFDVSIETVSPDGKPMSRSGTLFVLRRVTPPVNPVLAGVPWLSPPGIVPAEITVEEHRFTTDVATGKATVRLSVREAGEHVLRASGEDQFRQMVTTEASIRVAGSDDATRLRFFAESDAMSAGGSPVVRLHSMIDKGLALLTWEGESILSYRVVPVQAGHNEVRFDVGHDLYPNFALTASVMDGARLHSARKTFTVERGLRVKVQPKLGMYPPGSTGQVEITVTDQQGRPVEAELAMALLDETLLAVHPDGTPPIQAFFQSGVTRFADFRAASSNGFRYDAITTRVIKAYLEEADRLVQTERRQEELARARESLEALKSAAPAAPPAGRPARGGVTGGGSGAPGAPGAADVLLVGRASDARLGEREASRLLRLDVNAEGGPPMIGGFAGADDAGGIIARRDVDAAGWWNPSIITDAQGMAVIDLALPERASSWRLIARGVTVETLVGEATGQIVTRKDFFVEIKTPRAVREGDRPRVLARVHNLTEYAGRVELTMTVASGTRTIAEQRRSIEITKGQGGEALFEPFETPAAGELEITVAARAGAHGDAVRRALAVLPWGVEYASHGGGVTTGSTSVAVTLPPGLPYASRWLMVQVGPDLDRMLLDLVLGGSFTPAPRREAEHAGVAFPRSMPIWGGFEGSELLAAIAGLEYARAVEAPATDLDRLNARVRALVGAVVVSQQGDGGWALTPGASSDWYASSITYWALSRAMRAGVTVHLDTLARAEAYLLSAYQRSEAADNESKAVILHALSAGGKADFNLANALYRERQTLPPMAQAYAALAFANLDRLEIAAEILQLIEASGQPVAEQGRTLRSWSAPRGRYPWLHQEVETTAIVLAALMRVKPGSPQVHEAAQFLLHRAGCDGLMGGRERGVVLSALGGYFQAGRFASDDYVLTVTVNDQPVGTIARRGAGGMVTIDVPAQVLRDGANTVRFDLNGRGRYAYAATLRGFSSEFRDNPGAGLPQVESRRYVHAPLTYRSAPINAASSSPVKRIEVGQRVVVRVDMQNLHNPQPLVVEEPLPAGMTYVEGSLSGGSVSRVEQRDGRLVLHLPGGAMMPDFSYELVGFTTGEYRAAPTQVRAALDPSRLRLGKVDALSVLPPGEKSDDPYQINDHERFVLGSALFNDGLLAESLEYLWPLFDRPQKYSEREVARMLLWIHTVEYLFDPARVVSAFEILTVRHPDLTIPFDRILAVGRAYRHLGEFERAAIVFRATIDSSFLNDSMVSAVLEDEGQVLDSIDFQESLWWQYPDTPEVAASAFALSQQLYALSQRASELAKVARRVRVPGQAGANAAADRPTRVSLLTGAVRLLSDFLTRYPASPLADDAAFSMANAFLDLRDYDAVISLSQSFARRFREGEFAGGFQYMTALGHFWKRDYEPALAAARVVADGETADRDFARYILGQIHHAQGHPAQAIEWYNRVRALYPDAAEAIDYFERKRLSLDEVTIRRPGEKVELPIRYRNIREADVQVYRVDLMKLYLREKNLSQITQVNLAGIEPMVSTRLSLGDGRDYLDKERVTPLELKDEGAYLVICRGDDLFASGLVLITPLRIEAQEDAQSGRARINVIDDVKGNRPAGVHVKAIGSADSEFRSGETDLRGVFIADGLRGRVTAIARDESARYAFFRGETWLGAPEDRGRVPVQPAPQPQSVDYQGNLRLQNDALQRQNQMEWDQLRRQQPAGVEVQRAK